MATFMGEIVAMPTGRKAVKDKEGNVIAREERTRIVIEPRNASDQELVKHLFEIIGDAVIVSITLEQPGML